MPPFQEQTENIDVTPADEDMDSFDYEAPLKAALRAAGIVFPPIQGGIVGGSARSVVAELQVGRPPPRKAKPRHADYSSTTLSPPELAARWHVCVDKVLNFIRSGELPAFNVASTNSKRPRYRISVAEIERFEQQTRAAASPGQKPPEAPRRRNATHSRPAPKTYF
jgi:hypothetical protein